MSDELRRIPSIDRLLLRPDIQALITSYPRELVTDALRSVTDALRQQILAEQATDPINEDVIAAHAIAQVLKLAQPTLKRTVNATGVLLHTGLGRAVLATEAVQAICEVAAGHSNLEIDIATGRRGSRHDHVSGLLTRLTGAEAVMVVNNNAAAVLLAINSLADGQEVIISRGQLVEIGGHFRIPDVIRMAGCKLVEVGTTNRTRVSDYADAITDDTALILRVHPSNYKIIGFTEEPSVAELSELGKSRGVAVMDDLGSGALISAEALGLYGEPTVADSVKSGADLVTFSGDKLLGATQAGIIVGRPDLIGRCRKNPLARAVRIDKLTLAGLEATLRLYLDQEQALQQVPILHFITRPISELGDQAHDLANELKSVLGDDYEIDVVDVMSQVGGGSLPGQDIPSIGVTLRSGRESTENLTNWFRNGNTPVFGRIEDDRLIFDMRAVTADEAKIIARRAHELAERE